MSLPRDRANAAQREGADPGLSAFVGASAGSGKTKLLTDRLLRLMLGGARPERIQCLTFTKAAAAEMALRLQHRLGRWVTMNDTDLAEELKALSVTPTEQARTRARQLFAEVLDLPGGMRIGTIHSFCQSLLRRFPLEASLSPHFEVADERETSDRLTEAREVMLANAADPVRRDAIRLLAGFATSKDFHKLVGCLLQDRIRLSKLRKLEGKIGQAQRRALSVVLQGREQALAAAVDCQEINSMRDVLAELAQQGSDAVKSRAAELLEWLESDCGHRAANWDVWRRGFLNAKGEPYSDRTLVNRDLAKRAPHLLRAMADEAARVRDIEEACRALDLAALSDALATLALPVLDAYAERKGAAGLLDYGDLIAKSSELLVDPGAGWVLYKLDGGLDHLLLDEVQDTAPEQWRIAQALTGEFFAGAGAREAERTVFAVGDRKQSIFSFQGADADGFDRERAVLRKRVCDAGRRWAEPQLDVSFRSTPPVLALVDKVFADPIAARGVCGPGGLRHISDREGHAGRIELWPLAPAPDPAEPPPWTVPERNRGRMSAPQRLAEELARWIGAQTGGATMLESQGRPLRPGDVMVLVRRRTEFASALVKALKACGVPVAGLDRMVLTEQIAVQDALALCDALLLPQDDLQLACVLTSPLGFLSDDSLMELAVGRVGSLWDALRERAPEREDWRRAWEMLSALLSRVDYASPYALLSEMLGPMGGRARLIARLGPEAGEPVDELLNAALAHDRLHPPSLQGFLHWLRRSGAEIKREQEAAGDRVRVLTVHGAKGLQAPLVILPDTTALPRQERNRLLWAPDPETGVEVPLWAPRADLHCAASLALKQQAEARDLEEYNRLLYVALTRAEDRLLVCGWSPKNNLPEPCWYSRVLAAMKALGAKEEAFPAWDGVALTFASGQSLPPKPRQETRLPQGEEPLLPNWAGRPPAWRPAPPPPEPPRPTPLAPSRPEGVALGPVPPAASPLVSASRNGLERGRMIHALLQHLPELPPARRASAAERWLRARSVPEAADLAARIAALMEQPEVAPLFGDESRAEVAVSGIVAGQVVSGFVDRIAVLPGRVVIADYKSNRRVPPGPESTPVLYLRQMSAYRGVLRQIFPGRRIECLLIWTEAARADRLGDALLDRHAP